MRRPCRSIKATVLGRGPLVAGGVVLFGVAASWLPQDAPWVAAAVARIGRSGWASAGMLVATVAVSPIAQLVGWRGRGPARCRRDLGLATCALVALHIGWVLYAGWFTTLHELVTEPNLRSGATAAMILALLGLTSWPRLVRALRFGYWKPLHRAVYAAALLTVHHVALSGHARPRYVFALAAVVLALLAWRFLHFGAAALTRS